MMVGVKIVYLPKTSDKQQQQNNWGRDLTGTEILAGCQNKNSVFEDTNLVVIPSGMCLFNINVSRMTQKYCKGAVLYLTEHESEFFPCLEHP